MAKRAWCSGCNGYVLLTADELCPAGHPRPSLRAIEEIAGDARPSIPVRAVPRRPQPAFAATGDASAAAMDSAALGATAPSGFGAPPAPSYSPQSPQAPWSPTAVDALPESAGQAWWVVPAAIAGSICVAVVVALASPLAGLVLAGFAVGTLLSACSLWVGMKLTGESGPFLGLLAISAICGSVQLVPYVGGILAFIVMIALISRWMRLDVWPDAILMVVVARPVAMLGALVIAGMIFNM